jgi:hypothetical protein
MAECAKYFVPDDESRLIGKEHEVAEAFWKLGVFIATDDEFIYRRLADWQARGKPFPQCAHDFSFAEMGLGGSELGDVVPDPDHVVCPECDADITEAAQDVWYDEGAVLPLAAREVTCPECGAGTLSADLQSDEAPFTFSRFYLWITDVDPGDWDETFKKTVETVLGPCQEFTAVEN